MWRGNKHNCLELSVLLLEEHLSEISRANPISGAVELWQEGQNFRTAYHPDESTQALAFENGPSAVETLFAGLD